MKDFLVLLRRAFFGVILFMVPFHTQAASLYIDPAVSELNRGDTVTMSIRLDVDEDSQECINVIDGVLTYSSNIEPVDVTVSDSIFNVWVELPVIDKENRTITFAGGIPNGYCGRIIGDPRLTNTLAKVIFRSPGFSIGDNDDSTAIVEFTDQSKALLNDGFGTRAELVTYGASIQLNEIVSTTLNNSWKDEIVNDVTPPEKFTIELVKGDGDFSNKYYILFNTSDKQSGIDHYEVMEEPLNQMDLFQWGRADAPWIVAETPPVYTLDDQSLNSILRVKAVDKAGNIYIANLLPDESLRTLSRTQVVKFSVGGVLIVLVLISGYLIFYFFRRRKCEKDLPSDIKNHHEDGVQNEEEFSEGGYDDKN